MYHLKIESLKIPDKSLHFKKLNVSIMYIEVLMEATCTYELLHSSNLANDNGFKFYRIENPIYRKIDVGIQYFHITHHFSFLALLDMD